MLPSPATARKALRGRSCCLDLFIHDIETARRALDDYSDGLTANTRRSLGKMPPPIRDE